MDIPLQQIRKLRRFRAVRSNSPRAVLLALALLVCGAMSIRPAFGQSWPAGGIHDSADLPAQMQQQHWGENRGNSITYVPGKGYQVEGFPGYYQYPPTAQPEDQFLIPVDTDEARRAREARNDAERIGKAVAA